jgi:hypothetical protein
MSSALATLLADAGITVPAAPSAEVQVVALRPTAEASLKAACLALANENSIDRFELAVKHRLQVGIKDDNDLRKTDELLVNVVRGGDAVEALCKPATAAAHALHKAMTGTCNEWKARWNGMAEPLKRIILKYKAEQAEIARRQQEELERAAAEERKRAEEQARAAMRQGDVTAAKAAMETAQAIVTPVLMNATPALDHSTDRKPWEVTITDPEAVVKGIAAGIIPLSAIKEFDITFLKGEAKKRGGLPATWAGISAKQVDALSVRRR